MSSVRASKVRRPLRKVTQVARPRLENLLDATEGQKVAVIVAPAGFGKTTLLSAWAASTDAAVAWFSLDEADNEPERFLDHLVAALEVILPASIEPVRARLAVQPRPSLARGVGLIVDALEATSADAILAFDDFHVLTSAVVQDVVVTLVEATPSTFRVVVATRSDPPLALARLRARGELLEVRARELRFTRDEASALLRTLGASELSAAQVAELEARTEGWAAGLQLVALALKGRTDAEGFVAAFGGRHPFVFDYLADEVVGRESDEVQTFLTSTSILERLTGPLCDAVVGGDRSEGMLRYLERANLFVVALDDARQWYRYHRLFADVLHDRLRERASPDDVRTLHLRASRWFEHAGQVAEAVDHALSAGDDERAANLVERHSNGFVSWGELTTMRTWLAKLPRDVVHRRPHLLLLKAWCTFLPRTYDHADVHALLNEAERLLAAGAVDVEPRRSLVGTLAAIRTAVSSAEEDAPRTLAFARQAREYLGPETKAWANVLSLSEALAHEATGNARAAEGALVEAIAASAADPDAYVAQVAAMNLARVHFSRGALRSAAEVGESALALAGYGGGTATSPIDAYAHVVLGNVRYELNDLDDAAQRFEEAVRRGLADGHVRAQVDGSIGLAHVLLARGSVAGANEALRRASAYGQVRHATWSAPLVAWHRGLLALRSGDLEEATRSVASARVATDRILDAGGRSSHAVEARLLAANGHADAAIGVLNRALDAAEEQGRTRNALEVSIVRALVLDAQGRARDGLDGLAGALARAGREGHIRLFVDEGDPMRHLLRRALDAGLDPAYTARLIAAFGATPPARSRRTEGGRGHPFNAREVAVLRLMAGRLSDKEVARELSLSVSTVKWYSQRIFGALGVHRRSEAVARARELDIL